MSESTAACVDRYYHGVRQATRRLVAMGPPWLRGFLPAEMGSDQAGEFFAWSSPGERDAAVERVCVELRPYLLMRCQENRPVEVERVAADCLLYLGVRDGLPCRLHDEAPEKPTSPPANRAIPWLTLLFSLLLETVEATLAEWSAVWMERAGQPLDGDSPSAGPSVDASTVHWIGTALRAITQESREQMVAALLRSYVVEKALAPGARLSYWDYTFDPRGRADYRPFELGLRSLARRRAADLVPAEVLTALAALKRAAQARHDGSDGHEHEGENLPVAAHVSTQTVGSVEAVAEQLDCLRAYLSGRLAAVGAGRDPTRALARLRDEEDALVDEARARVSAQACDALATAGLDGRDDIWDLNAVLRELTTAPIAHQMASHAAPAQQAAHDRLRRARDLLALRLRQVGQERLNRLAGEYRGRGDDPPALLDGFVHRLGDPTRDSTAGAVHHPDLRDELWEKLRRLIWLCWLTDLSIVEVSGELAGQRPRRGNQPRRLLFQAPRGIADAFAICVAAMTVFAQDEASGLGKAAPLGEDARHQKGGDHAGARRSPDA